MNTNILIGIPTRGDIAAGLTMYLLNLDTDSKVTVLMDESKYLSNARNTILNYGLDEKEFTHILWIDSDIYPNANSNILNNMLDCDCDIICAPYFPTPSKNPVTGTVGTQLIEFLYEDGKVVKRALENTNVNHEVAGFLPIGFSLMKLDALRIHNRTEWFGVDQCLLEDITFGENALYEGLKFGYYAERVNHRVSAVIL